MLNHAETQSPLGPRAVKRGTTQSNSILLGRKRFAVCYTPKPGGAFASFGRSWFGRANDEVTLETFCTSGLAGLKNVNPSPLPDRYNGLHAPFFSPLTLREDTSLSLVQERLMAFAAHRKQVDTGPLALTCVNGSLVLQPTKPRPELSWLALQCFNGFESFAENSGAREPDYGHLGRHQWLLLKSFGQPNVMSEYRFRIALTGPLEPNQLGLVLETVRPMIADLCATGLCIDSLTLVADGSGDMQRAPMRRIGRYPLAE